LATGNYFADLEAAILTRNGSCILAAIAGAM